MADLFQSIDGLTPELIEGVAERLEARAEMPLFADMRSRYFEALGLADDAQIVELGGGTGAVGRAYAARPGFRGSYTVTDLSQALIDYGERKAKAQATYGGNLGLTGAHH